MTIPLEATSTRELFLIMSKCLIYNRLIFPFKVKIYVKFSRHFEFLWFCLTYKPNCNSVTQLHCSYYCTLEAIFFKVSALLPVLAYIHKYSHFLLYPPFYWGSYKIIVISLSFCPSGFLSVWHFSQELVISFIWFLAQ